MIYTKEDFKKMRKAGNVAMRTLDYIAAFIKEGVTTEYLDDLCNDFIVKKGAISACKGYMGYPRYTCISVNHVVCHGIPSPDKKLKKGDILNIDVTVILDGFYGDTSRMYTVGKGSVKSDKLISVTYESLWNAILNIRPGSHLYDIGDIISETVKPYKYGIVRDYCGHGVGAKFHEDPTVLHFKNRYSNLVLKPGMIFTIEPMINEGSYEVKMLQDDWTVVTKDKSLSAQFEHSIGITDDGVEVFTITDEEREKFSDKLSVW